MKIPIEKQHRLFKNVGSIPYLYFSKSRVYSIGKSEHATIYPARTATEYKVMKAEEEVPLTTLLTHPSPKIRKWAKRVTNQKTS